MARSWSFDRLSTVKIQPQSGTFRASCENNNCRLPSIEKKTQKAVLIISLQPSKARRNAHAAQRRCAGGGGDASRPASASAASKGLEAPTTLPGPPQCWASAPPEGRMADQVGHAARRAPLPAQMRGDLRVPPRRCRVQRIRGGVRARVRRVWALVPRPRGTRAPACSSWCAVPVTGARRLAIRMRGLSARSRETPLRSQARLVDRPSQHAFRNAKRKVCGQELPLVLCTHHMRAVDQKSWP